MLVRTEPEVDFDVLKDGDAVVVHQSCAFRNRVCGNSRVRSRPPAKRAQEWHVRTWMSYLALVIFLSFGV